MVIVYDVSVKRLNEVRRLLKQYFNWVQNSAFEGEISEGKLEEVKIKLFKIINKDEDSILVYKISNPKWIKKISWGVEKNPTEEII